MEVFKLYTEFMLLISSLPCIALALLVGTALALIYDGIACFKVMSPCFQSTVGMLRFSCGAFRSLFLLHYGILKDDNVIIATALTMAITYIFYSITFYTFSRKKHMLRQKLACSLRLMLPVLYMSISLEVFFPKRDLEQPKVGEFFTCVVSSSEIRLGVPVLLTTVIVRLLSWSKYTGDVNKFCSLVGKFRQIIRLKEILLQTEETYPKKIVKTTINAKWMGDYHMFKLDCLRTATRLLFYNCNVLHCASVRHSYIREKSAPL